MPAPHPHHSAEVCCDPDDPLYPGGAHCFAYKLAFNLWVLLFLGVICAGLLNFLGTYAKAFWPGL